MREFKYRRCHDLTYERAQFSRSQTLQMWLGQAKWWGCSYAEARDLFRLHMAGHIHRPAHLHFGPRKVRLALIIPDPRPSHLATPGG